MRQFVNQFANSNANVPQRFENWPSSAWPRLAKRYVEADACIHLHFQWLPAKNGIPCDFCLTFQRTVRDSDLREASIGFRWLDRYRAIVGERANEVERLVPVKVRQT